MSKWFTEMPMNKMSKWFRELLDHSSLARFLGMLLIFSGGWYVIHSRKIVTVEGQAASQIELSCPAGTSPLQNGVTINNLTGKFRQNACVDFFGNVYQALSGSSSAGLLNNQLTVGPSGSRYTTIAQAQNSADCPAAGCTIFIQNNATLDTVAVPLNHAGVHYVFDAGSYSYSGITGLFNCNAQVAGIRISGANRGATVGAAQGTVINITNTAASLVAAPNTQGCPGLMVDHLTALGPGSGTGVGLQLTGTRMELDSVLIASFGGNGATVDGSINNSNLGTCYHSRFQGNGGVGMLLTGVNSDGWVMNGCDWAGNTGDGFVCDGTSKFTTFQGTNGDSNISGIGYHFKNCSQSTGFLFADSATNNVTFDAASGQNWLHLVGGAPVSDSGSGNRILGNTNLPSYAWSALDMYGFNLFGVTSGRITSVIPSATGNVNVNIPAANSLWPTFLNCGTTSTCGQTNQTRLLSLMGGPIALVAGSLTVTSLPFTSSTSYVCSADDSTGINGIDVVYNSGASVTFNGTGTDSIRYQCDGN